MSISKSYNAWSKTYDTMPNKTRDLDKKATQQTLEGHHFNLVLELGCGTGKNTEWLIHQTKQLIALDFSTEMMAVAKTKIQSNKVRFVQADLKENWPVDNAIADLITCNLVVEHIQDLDPIFRQAFEKLKTGGLFFLCELHPFKQYKGSKARFDSDQGEHELEVYTHHLSEYLAAAKNNSFELQLLDEWFDEPQSGEIPRLISFLFKKN